MKTKRCQSQSSGQAIQSSYLTSICPCSKTAPIMYFLQLPSFCFPSTYFVMLRKCQETLVNLWPIMLPDGWSFGLLRTTLSPYLLCRPTQYLSVAVTSTCLARPFLLHALVKKPDSKLSTLMVDSDTSHWYRQKFRDISLKRKRWPFHIIFFLLSTNDMEVIARGLAIRTF